MKLFPSSSSSSKSDKEKTKKKLASAPANLRPSLPSSSSSDASSTTPNSVLPDGKFTPDEVRCALLRLGSTEAEAVAILAEARRDGDGMVDLEAVLDRAGGDEDEELRAAFGAYDANGDGKISAEELCEALRDLGVGAYSVEDCRRVIGGVDSDGDGILCFRDFARMMSLCDREGPAR